MPGWLWLLLGGAAGVFVMAALFFWIDYTNGRCPACGGRMWCADCGEWPHHEYQGVAQPTPSPPPPVP